MKHFGNVFTMILCLIVAANSGKNMIRDLAMTTQTCLSNWYVGCIGRRWCMVQMGRWDTTMLGHSVCSSMACMPLGILRLFQITRIAYSCRLGSQAEFVLGPDESKSANTFIG